MDKRSQWIEREDCCIIWFFQHGTRRERMVHRKKWDFKEQEDGLKNALTAHNLPCFVPNSRFTKPEHDMFAKIKFSQPGPPAFAPNSSTGRRDRPQPSRPRAQSNSLGVCYAFNNGSCIGAPTASGCKNVNTNRELAHVCNVDIDSEPAICLEKHPCNKHR